MYNGLSMYVPQAQGGGGLGITETPKYTPVIYELGTRELASFEDTGKISSTHWISE